VNEIPPVHYYEQIKADAHEVALHLRDQGLPLVIAMPNGVVGPNDHSLFGYLLRLYLMRMLPPMGWCPQMIISLVEVNALAEGIVFAA